MLMTTAMSSLTQIDGVFNLLNRTDVTKMFRHDDAESAEEAFAFADKLLSDLQAAGFLSNQKRCAIWGSFLVRTCLVMVNKEQHKSCFEKKIKFETLAHARGAFKVALEKAITGATKPKKFLDSCKWPRWSPTEGGIAEEKAPRGDHTAALALSAAQ